MKVILPNKLLLVPLNTKTLKITEPLTYIFDLNQFAAFFEEKTGSHLQYAVVRTNAILRKAGKVDLPDSISVRSTTERELILVCSRFPEVIALAYDKRELSEIAKFGYTLAKKFSVFYHTLHILKEKNKIIQNEWLALATLVNQILKKSLHLLGIATPEKMLNSLETIES